MIPNPCLAGRSYVVAEDGASITFSPCGLVSHHPEDVANRYCPHCHCFLDDAAKLEHSEADFRHRNQIEK